MRRSKFFRFCFFLAFAFSFLALFDSTAFAAYTNSWDEAAPSGSALASTLDDSIRTFKLDVRERFATSSANFNAGLFTLAPTIQTTGSPTLLTLTGPAHTTLTASTEATDVYLNLNRTVQFAAGALTTQRAIHITAPTYAFASASTLTNAYTLYVSGAPAAGTNATITNSYAFYSGGKTYLNSNVGIGVAPIANYNLYVSSTLAPATGAAYGVYLGGTITSSNSIAAGMVISPTIEPGAGQNAYGLLFASGFQRASSGTHSLAATVRIDAPTFEETGAVYTEAASLYIPGSPAGGTTNYSLYVNGYSYFLGTNSVGTGVTARGFYVNQTVTATDAAAYGFQATGTVTGGTSSNAAGVHFSHTLATKTSGTHTNYDGVLITAPTVTESGSGTVTTAASLRITNMPTIGSGDNYAILVDAGMSKFVAIQTSSLSAAGDDGGLVASGVTFTGSDNTGTGRSTGVGTIKFADATARDNVGFIKIYIGSTARYIPVFAAQ